MMNRLLQALDVDKQRLLWPARGFTGRNSNVEHDKTYECYVFETKQTLIWSKIEIMISYWLTICQSLSVGGIIS